MPVKRCVSCSYADSTKCDGNPELASQSRLFPWLLACILFVLVGMGAVFKTDCIGNFLPIGLGDRNGAVGIYGVHML